VIGKFLEPVVQFPALITQGDTASWQDQGFIDNLGNAYYSENWNLVYTIAGAISPLQLTAAAEGNGWQTTITAAQSATLQPGGDDWWWQAQLISNTDSSQVGTLAKGQFSVLVNLALQAAGYSGLSDAQQNLAAWRAALAALSGAGGSPVEMYRIGDRELRYRNMDEILKAIAYWNIEVINEQTKSSISQNQGNPRKLYARFPGKFTSINA
jgi:hypothetical protein